MKQVCGKFHLPLQQRMLVLLLFCCLAATPVFCADTQFMSPLWQSDGRLWFATARGLVATAKEIQVNELPPPVVIEEVLADKRVQSLKFKVQNPGDAGRSSTLNFEHGTLNLPPGLGELEFHYTALSFQAPEKNRFKYKLDGVDPDCVDAGTRRIAFYTNLCPGNYRFRVKGCNSDGIWNEQEAELAITLRPHFWQTWWFQSSVCIAAAGLVFGVDRIRRNRRREIERLRLRIAADLHDDIGSNLASIAILSQMEQPVCEDQRSDLAEINRIALNTAQNVREIVWFINPDYDSLHEMVERMKDVAANMLAGLKYDFRVPACSEEMQLSLEFRRNIFLAFKEALHNVVKHARATNIQIEIRAGGGELRLVVSDNGAGFCKDEIPRGNGLKNIRLRLAQIGGRAEIHSVPGQGTTLSIHARII